MPDDTLDLGYREIAERLGVSLAAAKARAKRQERKGRWTRHTGNAGEARYVIPVADLDTATPARDAPSRGVTGDTPSHTRDDVTGDALDALRSALDAERERSARLERERDQAVQRAHAAEVRAARLEGQLEAEQTRKRPIYVTPRGARAVLARLARGRK